MVTGPQIARFKFFNMYYFRWPMIKMCILETSSLHRRILELLKLFFSLYRTFETQKQYELPSLTTIIGVELLFKQKILTYCISYTTALSTLPNRIRCVSPHPVIVPEVPEAKLSELLGKQI